jgi:arabinofuranosyltransferase
MPIRATRNELRYTVAVVLSFAAVAILWLLLADTVSEWMFREGVAVNRLSGVRGETGGIEEYRMAVEGWLAAWYMRAMVLLLFGIFVWTHRDALTRKNDSDGKHVPLSLFMALLALAWANRFIQDDAFISFRYALNLAEGHGLVFNPGEAPVEGYTNFLWTLLLTIPHLLRWEPVMFSWLLSLCWYCLTLLVVFRLSMLLTDSWRSSLLLLLLLGTNYSFSAYATGGLETQMQTALMLVFAYIALRMLRERSASVPRLVSLSLLAALSMLTRPDSVLLLLPVSVALFWSLWKNVHGVSHRLKSMAAFVLPGLLIGVIYASWKMSFYGNILPNTYYVKVAVETSTLSGLRYIHYFLMTYGLYPFVVVLLYYVTRRPYDGARLALLATIALWVVYVVSIGGCFMEYRLMIPVLPMLLLLLVSALLNRMQHKPELLFIGGLLFMSFMHARVESTPTGVESIAHLHENVHGLGWERIGLELGSVFADGEPPVRIAVRAAGAIPYYSGLAAVDMFGLNDAFIARHGVSGGIRPGHQKVATLEYLLSSDVHLVIGHPRMLPNEAQPYNETHVYEMAAYDRDKLPPEACRVEIPIGRAHKIVALYLRRHTLIEQAIDEGVVRQLRW